MQSLSIKGTEQYFSPQLLEAYVIDEIEKCKYDPEKADVFSIGITFLRLCI